MTGRAGPQKTLPADLKRITHSGVLDIPKELLTPVVDAAANEEDRPEIMKHLRECLAETSGKNWRRIYGALVLIEALVKNGSEQLMVETAEGRHFDLVQRLSFLEHFENTDKRVMNNVRKKAEALRKEVVPLLNSAAYDAGNKEPEDSKDTASTCSPGESSAAPSVTSRSTAQSSTAAAPTAGGYTGFGSDSIPPPKMEDSSKRTMVLNNIVSVGHNEDTTSESDCAKDKKAAAVSYREPQRKTAKERNERSRGANSNSSDSEGAAQEPASKPIEQDLLGQSPESKPVAPAHTVDLLGL